MRSPLKKLFFLLMITLGLSEITLRVLGYNPGHWGKFEGFYPVDSLILAKNFVTDEYGIYKFGPWITDSLKNEKNFSWKNTMLIGDAAKNAVKESDNVSYVHATFKKLEKQGKEDYDFITKRLLKVMLEEKEDWDTEFPRAYNLIRQKSSLNKLEEAILNYVQNPYNKDGFRSIEFKTHDTSNVRILLIGDSFVYGMTATPFFNSFSDILLARGYEVYNAGIPAADPAQYAAIAKKYIPLLKPDFVIVFFFDGNDLMWFPKIAEQDIPHEYITNAGFFESYPLGKHLTAQEAHDYYLSLIQIPNEKLFDRICSKLAFTSLIWGILLKQEMVQHPKLNEYYKFREFDEDLAIGITRPYLSTIDSICLEYNVVLMNVIIPGIRYDLDTEYIEINLSEVEKLYDGNFYHSSEIFTIQDFGKKDRHFNNSGSLKMADYIEQIIQSNSGNPYLLYQCAKPKS